MTGCDGSRTLGSASEEPTPKEGNDVFWGGRIMTAEKLPLITLCNIPCTESIRANMHVFLTFITIVTIFMHHYISKVMESSRDVISLL